jgi:hypothetical protein
MPRRRQTVSDEELAHWRELASEARAMAAKESAATRNHFLKVAGHWEALIEELEAQRKPK